MHTADIRIRIQADTLAELFRARLEGLNQFLHSDSDKMKPDEALTVDIEVESADTTALLIDFLSDVLTLSHIHKAVFFELSIEELTNRTLKGALTGSKVSSFDRDIKAVTYHDS